MKKFFLLLVTSIFIVLFLVGFSTGVLQTSPQSKDQGIGPIKDMKLGPVNDKIALEGKNIFNTKCTICHEMNQKKIGPPLKDITKQRTPEFIMNLLLKCNGKTLK